jgi:hypothetical protein
MFGYNIDGVVITFTDITASKKLEAELRGHIEEKQELVKVDKGSE